ncbi:MAG: LPS assembly lipoprotein LptE [Pseudomonadales bacterium]|nr:LPS assembly lipoprotein LptE [Pseudomonadales bacterium]NRA15349.1 hypothetical protein [Oceanospirillaceae bacterium]
MFALSKTIGWSQFRLLATGLFFSLLIGCGFSLRGNIEIPVEAQSLWLVIEDQSSSQNSPLQKHFKALAEQNNLHIASDADYQIIVTSVNFRRISTTITSDAKVDEYTLRGELSFDILDPDEQVIASNLEAFSERTFQYDANDAAASNSREAFLNAELWSDLSQQILRQYAARLRIK